MLANIRSRLGAEVENQQLSATEGRIAAAIAIGGRILYGEGHDDINQGQISGRSAGNRDTFLIKQVLSGFDEVTPREIVRCPLESGIAAHPLAPPEIPLHQAIYAARPDVNAIVHSHALNSLAFGALDTPLQPISHEGACFSGRYTVFKGTSHTVLSIDVGREIAAALAQAKAVFLRNHGVVIVGSTVKEAVVLAAVLERACEIQLKVMATTLPFSRSSEEDIPLKQDFIFGSMSIGAFWDYYVRKVRRATPSGEDLSWFGAVNRT